MNTLTQVAIEYVVMSVTLQLEIVCHILGLFHHPIAQLLSIVFTVTIMFLAAKQQDTMFIPLLHQNMLHIAEHFTCIFAKIAIALRLNRMVVQVI